MIVLMLIYLCTNKATRRIRPEKIKVKVWKVFMCTRCLYLLKISTKFFLKAFICIYTDYNYVSMYAYDIPKVLSL